MKTSYLPPFAAVVSFALVGCLSGCPDKKGAGGAGTGGSPAAGATTPASGDAAKAATLGTSTISGKVKFDGAAPERGAYDMGGTPECAGQHAGGKFPLTEAVVVKDGGLANVIVHVKSGAGSGYAAPGEAKKTLDQQGCVYVPHVLALQVNEPVKIKNSDPFLHNVHGLPKQNPEFNTGQPNKGDEMTKKFGKPEIFKVKCEVHGWMSAWIGVFDHPFFAVSAEDGSFKLEKLPAGKYTLEAWHEKLGKQTAEVTIDKDGESKTADFTFKAE